MKIFYVQQDKGIRDFLWSLYEAGHEVFEIEDLVLDPNEESEETLLSIENVLDSRHFDMVAAQVFFPKLSDICEKRGIFFLSWTYDSPLGAFYSKSIKNKHNITFVFDGEEARGLKEQGGVHVHHMPLACNLTRVGALDITEEDENKYSSDISFVGSLYNDNLYDKVINVVSEDVRREMQNTLSPFICKWDSPKQWFRLSDSVLSDLSFLTEGSHLHNFDMDVHDFFAFPLYGRKLAQTDRITALNALAESFKVDLYSYEGSEFLQGVNIKPSVRYYDEMNKVFYFSKINLNFTIPSIRTGIPQRVFDILGCGGFLLTNYQKETVLPCSIFI